MTFILMNLHSVERPISRLQCHEAMDVDKTLCPMCHGATKISKLYEEKCGATLRVITVMSQNYCARDDTQRHIMENDLNAANLTPSKHHVVTVTSYNYGNMT